MPSRQNPCIVIDARCLQDPAYADRSIGRHAANLLRHAPRPVGRSIIGLIDPTLPVLTADYRAYFDLTRPNARFLELHDVACLISPSPMTHDVLFTARFLEDARPVKAAVVYDFISYEQPKAQGPARRLGPLLALRWLARYQLLFPNSRASANAAQRILGVSADCVAVTGVAVDSVFAVSAQPTGAYHILVAGGDDPNSNAECPVRAHARCSILQSARIPIVVTGRCGDDGIAKLRAIVASTGGDPSLLVLPGPMTDAELAELYRRSFCVVAASRTEDFALPIIEAMACGVPVLTSDTAAHAELVSDPTCRFGADDVARLAYLFTEVVSNQSWRTAILRTQGKLWPAFNAAEVAARFWNPIMARLSAAAAPAVARGRKPRVALVTPLQPDRSGVAVYSAASCAEIGRVTDLHVFTETASPAKPPGVAAVHRLSTLPYVSARFDRVINVLGNSDLHLSIFQQLLRHGGACVGHDSRMLGFYRILLGMKRATDVASRELKRSISPHQIDAWLADEASLEAVFYGEIVAAADPMIVHSPLLAKLLRERYGIAPVQLPFCIQLPWRMEQLAHRSEARRALGLPEEEVVLASFGAVHRTKAPADCVWALDMLRSRGIKASLHFVGFNYEGRELETLASSLNLNDSVRFLGEYVSEETYRAYLVAADVALQLRRIYLGSISGALQDCIAAGLPTVANESLAEMLDAPSYVRRVPDRFNPLIIAEAVADLLGSGLICARPEAEREAYCAAHDFAEYARGLCRALQLDVSL